MTTFTIITVASAAIAALCVAYAWLVAKNERERSAARVAALAAAIEGDVAAAPADAMFARGAGSMVQGRPLLKVAIGFGMAVFIIVVVAMTGDRHAAPEAVTAEERQEAEALELLSMRHTRQGETLTVTGLVRNPSTATAGDIMAVVFAFDGDGSFVASGRAPLEFATIANGDESPFKVTVPEVKDVSRYRVSFRTADGVVRHVDRRPSVAGGASAPAALQMSSN